MIHRTGTRLDGIASLEDLRQRCVVDEDTGCWHLRTARGRRLPKETRHVLWIFGVGHVTSTRAAWMLAHPEKSLPPRWICYRHCDSYDCVCPKHVLAGTRKAWGAHMARSGKSVTVAKSAANRGGMRSHWKLTPELKRWLLESPQSGSEVAHALGITQGRANAIRAKERSRLPANSVFQLGARA